MELRDLQNEELNILKECLKIFKKYDLKYFMLGGTFLGAVRHKGFIPWDDDIDIGMPRDDYEKFIEVASIELPSHLTVENFKKNKDYPNYIIKIMNKNFKFHRDDTFVENGISYLWIDIFPLDGVPASRLAFKFHKFNLLYRRLMLQYSKFKTGVNIKKQRHGIEKFLFNFGKIFTKVVHLNTNKQLFKLDKVMKKYPYNSSKNVVNFMGAYKFKEMFPKAYYDEPAMYDFEDIKLCAPANYDAVLTQMYGEYMKPPAENQKYSHSIIMENEEEKN